MKSHALYRFYGDTGQLLYVGITQDPGKRLAQHTATKNWWTSVRGISIDWYSSRADAAAAERRAITVERPLMNVQRPSVKPPVHVAEPPRRCGHCAPCVYSTAEDYMECQIYGMTDDRGELTGDPCRHCGKMDCLYPVGMEDGEQFGWMRASDFYGTGGGR